MHPLFIRFCIINDEQYEISAGTKRNIAGINLNSRNCQGSDLVLCSSNSPTIMLCSQNKMFLPNTLFSAYKTTTNHIITTYTALSNTFSIWISYYHSHFWHFATRTAIRQTTIIIIILKLTTVIIVLGLNSSPK